MNAVDPQMAGVASVPGATEIRETPNNAGAGDGMAATV